MYDIHCHLIPRVDDGADGIEETMDMLSIAAKGSTKGVICTPHSNYQSIYQNFWNEAFERKLSDIRTEAEKRDIQVKIYSGQEIFLTEDVIERLKNNELITLNNSKYVLVELALNENYFSAFKKIEIFKSEGYIPIIAHPERYGFVIEFEDAAKRLKKEGCLLQINKGSLKGSFGEAVAVTAHRLLAERMADFVASDAHSPYKRTPNLRGVHEMVSTIYSTDYADFLFKDNPLRVIEDKNIYGF